MGRNTEKSERVSGLDTEHMDALTKSSKLRDDIPVEHVVCSAQDITERKRSKQELRDIAQRLYAVFDAAESVPVQGYDVERRVLFWNKASEQLYGYTRDEAIGKRLEDLIIPASMREDVIEGVERWLAAGEPIPNGEFTLVDKNGADITVFSSHIMVTNDKGEKEMFCVDVDLTERKQAEEKLYHRLEFERLITGISTYFINLAPDEIDNGINSALEKIGEFADVDRSYVFLFYDNGTKLSNTHEWCNKGIEPQIDNLQGLHVEVFQHWMERLNRFESIHIPRVADLPPGSNAEKEIVQAQNIQSLIVVPINYGRSLVGLLGFNSVQREKTWPEDIIMLLRIVGEVIANALEHKRAEEKLLRLKNQLREENVYLRKEIQQEHNFGEIIGNSDGLRYVLFRVEQIASADTTVLILGETGTGKELIARAIHSSSSRKERPLIKVNCAALPAHLIESELFGHEKGAFTGATAKRIGRFELADGATLFLDEIGEMPLELQSRLLRVLQDGEFERVGSSRTIKVDVRLIAATNRDLETEIQAGRFRQDLFYRLNVYSLTLPPLRECREDIPLLTDAFIKRYNKKTEKRIKRISQKTMDALNAYSWPGNVRELQNLIEKSVIMAQDNTLRVELPEIQTPMPSSEFIKTLAETERDYIQQVLKLKNWRIDGPEGAAVVLDLKPGTLRFRMQKLGIKRPS